MVQGIEYGRNGAGRVHCHMRNIVCVGMVWYGCCMGIGNGTVWLLYGNGMVWLLYGNGMVWLTLCIFCGSSGGQHTLPAPPPLPSWHILTVTSLLA